MNHVGLSKRESITKITPMARYSISTLICCVLRLNLLFRNLFWESWFNLNIFVLRYYVILYHIGMVVMTSPARHFSHSQEMTDV